MLLYWRTLDGWVGLDTRQGAGVNRDDDATYIRKNNVYEYTSKNYPDYLLICTISEGAGKTGHVLQVAVDIYNENK